MSGSDSDNQDYGFGDRLLHRLALGIPAITRMSFDMDDLASAGTPDTRGRRHVFVSGLARAGTTVLMRTLYGTGRFCSLTYRDMPFVLMPCAWKRLSRSFRKDLAAKERAHGDGILVNYDSPESFEEVFWRIFCAGDYIAADRLLPHTADDEVIDSYRTYVSRIIHCADNRGPERYLSKNNNNILRLASIRRAFPAAIVIIPFREPQQHANSLLRQHRQFSERHAQDTFSRDYMRWLGHHEFGLTHKAFRFPGHEAVPLEGYTPDDINYWVALWINAYSYVLDTLHAGCRLLSFESLCTAPQQTLTRLFSSVDLPVTEDTLQHDIRPLPASATDPVRPELLQTATDVYQRMLAQELAEPASTGPAT